MIMNLVVIRVCLLHHSANCSVSTNSEHHCLIVGLLGYMTNTRLAFSTRWVLCACKFVCICLISNQVHTLYLTLYLLLVILLGVGCLQFAFWPYSCDSQHRYRCKYCVRISMGSSSYRSCIFPSVLAANGFMLDP